MQIVSFLLLGTLSATVFTSSLGAESVAKSSVKLSTTPRTGRPNPKYPKPHYLLTVGKEEGLPMFSIVNVALENYRFKTEFPWCLHVMITIKEKNRAQLPTSKEAKILDKLEDEISASLDKTCHYHFLGRTSWNGIREIFYSLDTPQKAHKALQTFTSAKHPTRQMEYKIEEDKDWHEAAFLFDYKTKSTKP